MVQNLLHWRDKLYYLIKFYDISPLKGVYSYFGSCDLFHTLFNKKLYDFHKTCKITILRPRKCLSKFHEFINLTSTTRRKTNFTIPLSVKNEVMAYKKSICNNFLFIFKKNVKNK